VILREVARVRCHGFSQRELTSALKGMQVRARLARRGVAWQGVAGGGVV
jgi:hypothetical protein